MVSSDGAWPHLKQQLVSSKEYQSEEEKKEFSNHQTLVKKTSELQISFRLTSFFPSTSDPTIHEQIFNIF